MIYNPAAGQRLFQKPKPVAAIAEAMGEHVGEVLLLPTTSELRTGAQARLAIDKGCDLIAPLGGDGTINEALQVVADTEATLLPLPGGTANVLARELDLGLDPVRVASMLPKLEERSVELGAVKFEATSSRRLFLLMCGAGLDASAVSEVNAAFKKRFGMLAYVWSGLRQVFRPLRTIGVTVGEELLSTGLVVISKSKLYGGGLKITPNAHLLDNALEVVCFPPDSSLLYPGYLVVVLAGRTGQVSGIEHRRARSTQLAGDGRLPIAVQVDGELVGELPARVELGPERLKLLGPSAYWSLIG